jgi:membrane-associated phospholipid phosphatase
MFRTRLRLSSPGAALVLGSLALSVTLAPRAARADDLDADRAAAGARLPAGIADVKHDAAISGGIAASALSLSFAMETAKPYIAPSRCLWCARDEHGASTLNGLDDGVRRALVWRRPTVAAAISDVAGLVLVPGVAYGGVAWASTRDGAGAAFPVDALLVLEASALAVAATQVVKVAAGRQRPFAHERDERARELGEGPRPPDSSDENLSFPSGHTSIAMSLATAAGTVASMRGYSGAPVVWATGVPLSLLTGYLRMGADRHYFTDVLAGAALGAACGLLVPLAFHPPR